MSNYFPIECLLDDCINMFDYSSSLTAEETEKRHKKLDRLIELEDKLKSGRISAYDFIEEFTDATADIEVLTTKASFRKGLIIGYMLALYFQRDHGKL